LVAYTSFVCRLSERTYVTVTVSDNNIFNSRVDFLSVTLYYISVIWSGLSTRLLNHTVYR